MAKMVWLTKKERDVVRGAIRSRLDEELGAQDRAALHRVLVKIDRRASSKKPPSGDNGA